MQRSFHVAAAPGVRAVGGENLLLRRHPKRVAKSTSPTAVLAAQARATDLGDLRGDVDGAGTEHLDEVVAHFPALDNRQRKGLSNGVDAELAAIQVPTLFVLGSNDPYLSPREARPSIGRIPIAKVHEMPAGHGPWLVDPAGVAGLIAAHIDPQVDANSDGQRTFSQTT